MSPFIPIEIQINILERLPVKTLVRCTAVCKSWYSIIKNPTFLQTHLMLSSSATNNPEHKGHTLFMLDELRNDTENNCIVLSRNSFAVNETFSFNFESNDQDTLLTNIGRCCNGVICLSENRPDVLREKLFLLNPSIRKLRPLPSSSSEACLKKPGAKVASYLGFGYDQITNDYRVVRIFRIGLGVGSDWSLLNEYAFLKPDAELEAEVYSLRSNSWKRVEMNYNRFFHAHAVLVNNSIHWLTSAYGFTPELIVAFDFRDEVFRDMAVPIGHGSRCTHILSYKGSLAILEFDEFQEVDPDEVVGDASDEEQEDLLTISLWVMKEYGVMESWRKEFTGIIHSSFAFPVDFSRDGKLIFQSTDAKMAAWDPESGQVIDLVGFQEDEYYNVIEDYMESLILI